MPLFAGLTLPPPEPSGPVIVNPFREDVGAPRFTMRDPVGTLWDLSDIGPERGYFTRNGVAGWGAQTFEFVTDPQPRGGDSVRYIRPQPARLTLPLHLWGGTHMQFTERRWALRRAFMMTVHRSVPAQLIVSRPDGSARTVDFYYEDGWRGEPGEDWLFANPVLTLFCPAGTWRDTVRKEFPFSGSEPVPFNAPFLTLSSGQVLGDATIDNSGDVTAWPEWTITGPCTSLVATNVTTGQSFTLTHSLAAGEVITITTDRPMVRGPGDTNLSSALNWPSAYLWGLLPGVNAVNFTVGGATTDTLIVLGFYPRYEGA